MPLLQSISLESDEIDDILKEHKFRHFKISFIGPQSGKSSLIKRYEANTWEKHHESTVFETHQIQVTRNGGKILCHLSVWELGENPSVQVEEIVLQETDVFVVVMSCADPDHLELIKEYKGTTEGAPLILCLNKIDCREDYEMLTDLKRNSLCPITTEHFQDLAKEMNAAGYIECSAKTGSNVKELFHLISEACSMAHRA